MGLGDVQSVACEGETVVAIDSRAPLFPHIPALLFAMHLVYEVNKEKYGIIACDPVLDDVCRS